MRKALSADQQKAQMVNRIAELKEERQAKRDEVEKLQDDIKALIQKDEDDKEKDKFHDEELKRVKDMIEDFKTEIDTFLKTPE